MEKLHLKVHKSLSRNSERNFPRGSIRMGLLKRKFVGATTERRGNLFRLLCLSHTDAGQDWLFPMLSINNIDPQKYLECLKLYLSMEEWYHETNKKEEVRSARQLIGEVIQLVHKIFPRSEGQGWNIPKTHGLKKIQYYMCLFGSAINFFGGPGECNHKKFVKATGNNTQCRIDSFSSQIAQRYYETMLLEIAKVTKDGRVAENFELVGKLASELTTIMSGEYTLTVGCITDPIEYSCSWTHKSKGMPSCDVHGEFVDTIVEFLDQEGWDKGFFCKGIYKL